MLNGDGKALSVTRGLVTATELQQSLTHAVTSFHSQVHFVLYWHKLPFMTLKVKQAVKTTSQLLCTACLVGHIVSTDGDIMCTSVMQESSLPPQPVQSPSHATLSSNATPHSTGTTSQHVWVSTK